MLHKVAYMQVKMILYRYFTSTERGEGTVTREVTQQVGELFRGFEIYKDALTPRDHRVLQAQVIGTCAM
jgi:hypothetical protein